MSNILIIIILYTIVVINLFVFLMMKLFADKFIDMGHYNDFEKYKNKYLEELKKDVLHEEELKKETFYEALFKLAKIPFPLRMYSERIEICEEINIFMFKLKDKILHKESYQFKEE